ncbi:MAG TPA: metallophosphoesterase [Phycisphaerae bacterium]|nr:metallophosphoesterase [Phycisphaerae bacterium]HRW51492.1 metallophosphoesterase [Phycisphaerae bacterium]
MNGNDIISRRSFLSGTAAALAATALPRRVELFAAAPAPRIVRPRSEALYGFALLGDLHYDRWDHHDMDWVRREKGKDVRQIEGYVESTEKHTPRLFSRVREMIATSPSKIAGVVHVGDFVEGLCGSAALQTTQFRDAMKFVGDSKLGTPFLMTKGNHDITGPGAREAFDDVLLPWMMKNADIRATASSNYTWTYGNDLFVFFDAYQPDLDWLASKSKEAAAAKRVFFVIHPPVVPYNARSNWHVFHSESDRESRQRLLAWLGRHGAIVLSGHLHRYAMLTRRTTGGDFTQFAVCSVIRSEREQPQKTRSGLDDYNEGLLELEPKFSPDTRERRKQLILEEKPSITSFDYARVPGFAMLWVYPDAVQADVYLGYQNDVWKQPRLDRSGRPTI